MKEQLSYDEKIERLMEAVEEEDIEEILRLKEDGRLMHGDSYLDLYGALECAAEKGSLPIVECLAEELVGRDTDCGLIAAAANGHSDIVDHLLSLGVHPDVGDGEALLVAAENGHFDVVKVLTSSRYLKRVEKYLGAALEYAAENGHINIVKYLFSKGASLKSDDWDPLGAAIENGYFDIAECIIENSDDTEALANMALVPAVQENQLEFAAKLVSYGADLNKLSSSQREALEKYMLPKKMTKNRKL